MARVIDEVAGIVLDERDANDPSPFAGVGLPADDGDAFDADFYGAVTAQMAAEWGREDAEPRGDLTPAEFEACVREECPGVPVAYNCRQNGWVGFPVGYPQCDAMYEARCYFGGRLVPVYVYGDSFRALAQNIKAGYEAARAAAEQADADRERRASALEAGMSASA